MESPVWNQTLACILYFNEDSFTKYSVIDNKILAMNVPERTDGKTVNCLNQKIFKVQ